MATRGNATIVGWSRKGSLMIEPDDHAMEVVMEAMKHREQIEIRLTVPTRGKRRRAADHKLRIAE